MDTKENVMTRIIRSLMALLFALFAASPAAFAQAPRSFSQPELDQMLAPVALYPDSLLSQVLMAATYPDEVVEAARWTSAYPGLPADDAVRAVDNQDWDPSVKSLVAFPQVLGRMDQNIGWTRALGEAFITQEAQVMDTVQQLRWRAHAAGNLQSDEQIRVEQQGQVFVLQPASPQYVYVPYYDPLVVYGSWWWPAYQPVSWAPWPGYAQRTRPGYSSGFWWGRPVGVSVSFFFGNVDWRSRRVHVVNNYYHRHHAGAHRGHWQHNPQRRRAADMRRAGEARPAALPRQAPAQAQQRQVPAQVQQRQVPAQAQPRQLPAQIQQRQTPAQLQRPDAARLQRREAAREPVQVPARVQGQAPARLQAQPTVATPAQPRAVPESRVQRQPAPAATPQQRIERQERREERREERQLQRGERPRQAGERR